MFEEQDEKYLIRLLGRNEVVLFLGAGFSLDAKNKIGESFPTGWALGEKLWQFLGYPGEYDGTSLPILYQAFIGAGIKRDLKTNFLNENLSSGDIPSSYNRITIPYWYKIYTINIDDIVQKVYARKGKKLRELIFPHDEFKERDQSLDEIHIVHLHGKLPCIPEDVVFSTKQYARAGLREQPLYSQFVYDYATHPTIFIGTDLNEPLFERYIESREGREGFGELRPRSFIITPSISPVKAQILKNDYNVHHIVGTTEDFFNWLESKASNLPDKNEILKQTFPNLLNVLEFATVSNINTKSVSDFAETFKRVPKEYTISNTRSAYLLGTNPSWNDIYNNLDIPRTISNNIYNQLFDLCTRQHPNTKQKVFSIIGTAGSGKSTIIKRLGLNLSQNGITVFITDSDFLPRIDKIVDVLAAIKDRVVLIFDNATSVLSQIPNLVHAFAKLENPPIILFSVRTNLKDKLVYYTDPDITEHFSYTIPNLDDDEITALIAKLDQYNLLSKLKGMSDARRFSEFKFRAKKQILVAMKEATNGMSFNEIIQSEFDSIEPFEAKILCLCIALNTELGFSNSKQDFVGFSEANHIETLHYLHNVLDGTINWVGNSGNFMIRHRILADYMIRHCANLNMLKTAYIRVLSVLAPELINSQYSKKFSLYKSLINHKILFFRFQNDINMAREVYDSITSYFHYDAQFWLQYGSLELEGNGGNFILAENYINQAESIDPKNIHIQNAKCNLFYKMSTIQDDYSHALDYKQQADQLSNQLMISHGDKDPHIPHIHCRGTYYFIMKWITNREARTNELEMLRKKINSSASQHPRDKKLQIAADAINRAYLLQATLDPSIISPEIPD
ncbi:SIR2 family NAD-dependent protein deacylase [Fluviicola chungangensis]|uniref:AAA+ ATPase domain-containing protein n=1 Tax=Fluviicola chungangensis TaxID=2597671 RepID=A0A556MJL8_9FLAO|nr:SIR2 family protein [Fluviicola chungangensis]TSJ40076.1 hypothetical protein FO442_15875 [Fluviicola chungangensis]